MGTRFVTFLTDYGPHDEFVGVCHAVIARIAPDVRVIDLAHGIQGIRAAASALAQSVAYCPDGAVHLAVVDPGVGTTRRGVVVVSRSGAALIGPDNGLLLGAAHALGGIEAAHELTNSRYMLEPVSSTFHGRDVFAPMAAHLASGARPEDLGPAISPATLSQLPVAHVAVGEHELTADVLRADWFGNLQLAARSAHLHSAGLSEALEISAGGRTFSAIVGRTFADAREGRLIVLVDAADHVAVCANGASAAAQLGNPARVTIRVRPQASGSMRNPNE